jgi:hypothetical protein
MKAKIFSIALSFSSLVLFSQQVSINKLWNFNNANPTTNEQVGCTIDLNGNFVYFSNHKPGSNCDMSLNCVTPNGSLGWQNSCNSCPSTNDYGSDVVTDNLGNIYVCGAKNNTNNLDYYVAKYSPTGTLIWSQIYNGTGNNDDIPADIELDVSGNVYVTGSSYGTGLSFTDIVTIKYSNSGVSQWVKRYNFGSNPEAGIALKLDNSNNVFVCGSAANNMSDADFIVLKYDPITGNQLNVIRHSSIGNGLDAPSEMAIDNNNKIYVVGTAQSGNNKNIKILALTNSLTALWANYIDKSGNNDEGFGVEINSSSEILITGYSQKANNGTNLIINKYNSSNGNLIWSYNKTAKIDNSIAKGRKVKKASNGNIVVAGEIQEGNSRNIYVLELTQNATPVWEKQLNNGLGSNSARNLIVDNNNIYVNGLSDNGLIKQVTTTKLSAELNANPAITIGGVASHVDDELIIQFDSKDVIPTLFQSIDFQFGALAEFVQPYVIKKMDSIYPIEGSWAKTKTRKMFMNMTNADTISLSREGIFVDMKDLWPTLVVTAPIPSEQAAGDSLSKFYPTIRYATANHFYFLDATNPNDPQFQSGNQSGYTNATHGINLPQAWNMTTGASNIKIGVFDTGINFYHEDYGNGTFSGSKIADGKDFSTNAHISTFATPDDQGHGSATSGIIGALSNNSKGLAGITGGDASTGNKGCPLYAMKIGTNAGLYPTNTIASGIVEGSVYNPNTNYGYGLHVQNHSWGGPANNPSLAQAVGTAYNNSSAFVVSSGNYPSPSCGSIDCVNYPASYNDATVMKVGANDAGGSQSNFSVQDNNLDFIAPGVGAIYATLDNTSNNGYTYNGDGTSFSAPHVTGLVGLMMSVHNTTMGAPAHLAPEDVEKLIQDNCTDVGASGYDINNGHGRVNAGLSVSKIKYPVYQIRHPNFQSNAQTVGPPNTQIILLNSSNGVSAGTYFATRYQVTWAYSEIFPATANILNWWNRPSSEVGFNGTNPVTAQTDVQYVVNAQTSNAIFLNATAFCYNITSNILAQAMNSWIPSTPAGLRAAFSVYAHDPAAIIGINENENDESEIALYPNPTKDLITISYGNIKDNEATLEITDATGKLISKSNFKTTGTTSLTINMSHLQDGIYFCKLYSTSFNAVKKFVKI